jgi:hypothetical protein
MRNPSMRVRRQGTEGQRWIVPSARLPSASFPERRSSIAAAHDAKDTRCHNFIRQTFACRKKPGQDTRQPWQTSLPSELRVIVADQHSQTSNSNFLAGRRRLCWIELQSSLYNRNVAHRTTLRRAPEPLSANSESSNTAASPTVHHRIPHVLFTPSCRSSSIDSTTGRFVPTITRGIESGPGRRRALRRAGAGREGLVGVTAVQGHQATVLCGGCREQAWFAPAVIPQLVDGTEALQLA